MPTLQTDYITILGAFARLFSKHLWKQAKTLLIGAILSPAERTVTAALRVMGLSGEKHFQNYHRVLNRAIWSSLEASHILFGLLISAFANSGPIIMGLDDTIERSNPKSTAPSFQLPLFSLCSVPFYPYLLDKVRVSLLLLSAISQRCPPYLDVFV